MELDTEILAQLETVGGRKLIDELFALYVTHAPARRERIQRALDAEDAESAAKAFHSLRSSSAMLGATALVETLKDLEHTASNGDIAKVAASWPAAEQQMLQLLDSLDRLQRRERGVDREEDCGS